MRILTTALINLVFLTIPAFALAKTFDGQTPRVETMCEETYKTQSATPGLYGLCVAYCEAGDFNDVRNDDDSLSKYIAAKGKLLERFNHLKKAADPELPCLAQGTCPAFTAEQLSLIGSHGWQSTFDDNGFTSASRENFRDYEIEPLTVFSNFQGLIKGEIIWSYVDGIKGNEDDQIMGIFQHWHRTYTSFTEYTVAPDDPDIYNTAVMDREQYRACYQLISDNIIEENAGNVEQ